MSYFSLQKKTDRCEEIITSARNFALFNKIALNLLKQDKSKGSLKIDIVDPGVVKLFSTDLSENYIFVRFNDNQNETIIVYHFKAN